MVGGTQQVSGAFSSGRTAALCPLYSKSSRPWPQTLARTILLSASVSVTILVLS